MLKEKKTNYEEDACVLCCKHIFWSKHANQLAPTCPDLLKIKPRDS